MNRIFHARIVWYQYFLLVVLGVNAFGFLWCKNIILATLMMLFLIVVIEQIIHTVYTVTADGLLLLNHGRFIRKKTIPIAEITSIRKVHSMKFGSFSVTNYLLIEYGKGKYASVLPAMEKAGICHEDACQYANDGCTETVIAGKSAIVVWQYEMVKTVELTLFGGNENPCVKPVSMKKNSIHGADFVPKTNLLIGIESKKPQELTTFSEFLSAFFEQMDHQLDHYFLMIKQKMQEDQTVSITSPFTAGTFEKCLRTGKDPLRGGGFDITNYQLLSGSIGTAADCLYAIQSAVYEKKLVTMEELIKALSVDFEGYEVLRQQLLHLPKYGNDKKEVDALAKQIADHFLARVNAFRGPENTLLYPGLYNIDFKIFANVTGATPDGRRFRDAIAEHCSPTPGAAKKGPTAILNSASTLPMKEGFASSVLHLTLDKNGYSMGADRIKIIDTLLRASEKKKIPVLSLTMYDKAELLDAQLHPEKHQDLIVRVWGFQARFTELDKELQDHIINRIS